MLSKCGRVAEAVVDWLNDPARDWDLAFTAVLDWAPDKDLSGLSDLTVQVAPDRPEPTDQDTRADDKGGILVSIGVRQKYADYGPISSEWIDARAALVEAIEEGIGDLSVSGVGIACTLDTVTIDPLVDPAAIRDLRAFVGVIDLRFEVTK